MPKLISDLRQPSQACAGSGRNLSQLRDEEGWRRGGGRSQGWIPTSFRQETPPCTGCEVSVKVGGRAWRLCGPSPGVHRGEVKPSLLLVRLQLLSGWCPFLWFFLQDGPVFPDSVLAPVTLRNCPTALRNGGPFQLAEFWGFDCLASQVDIERQGERASPLPSGTEGGGGLNARP